MQTDSHNIRKRFSQNFLKDQNVIECKSFDDLLRCEIDAIFICSYVSYAADYTIKALSLINISEPTRLMRI